MEYSDAFDKDGNKLEGILIRGKERPEGVYVKAVQIYTFDRSGKLLITRRHPDKVYGLDWEVTAGAVQKDESEVQAAVRELYEETGLKVREEQLAEYIRQTEGFCLWIVFMVRLESDEPVIRLQDRETVDYRWVSLEDFYVMLEADYFPEPMKQRHFKAKEAFDKTLEAALGFVL